MKFTSVLALVALSLIDADQAIKLRDEAAIKAAINSGNVSVPLM